MAIRAIVAVDPNGAIGRAGTVPWHYPEDLAFFKRQTMGQVVAMGRRTWESLPNAPLPGRLNLVLSRRGAIEHDGPVVSLSALDDVLELVPYLARDLYVAGGASLYRAFAPHIEEWVVTRVPEAAEKADTFVPQGFLDDYHLTRTERLSDELVVEFHGPKS